VSTRPLTGEVIRLTTPTLSAADPTTRAQWAVGNALGILYPSAVPLRDGRVRLTTRDDLLSARAMRAIEELLARRAADRISEDRLLEYGRGLRDIAAFDLERMPQEPHAAVEYTVLGTALYEPVLLALRRLAHQDVAARRDLPG